MRTFIAIPLPPECQSMLMQIQSKMRSSGADVRWSAIPSIHLTLKFLGEIDRALLPRLSAALRGVDRQPAFSLCARGLGAFPNLQNPRVIWCGIQGEIEKLGNLQQAVEKACTEIGFVPEDRLFRPHLTLGRVQGKKNLHHLLDYIKIGLEVECSFGVNHFNVYQSVLSPRGARYSVLEEFVLA